VEAVIDKDLTAALLGRQLRADALLLLTDVPAVQDGDGTPLARAIRLVTPAALRARKFPAVSMAPSSRPHAGSWRRRGRWQPSGSSPTLRRSSPGRQEPSLLPSGAETDLCRRVLGLAR
jgi:Amino acid kinase family